MGLVGLTEWPGLDELAAALEKTRLCRQPEIDRMDEIDLAWKAWQRRKRTEGITGTAAGLLPFCKAHGYGVREAFAAIRGAL